ncbi:DUF4023 family protein [Paenibacillus sp. GD4]|jgi:hypothetical protein|nr:MULTISPECIES: DUF4023 family protein [Paenibacillus]MDQ1909108.1 DUF4023 family protein [Paenibacillus sp. GD4]
MTDNTMDTAGFVQKVHETQAKQEKNKRSQGQKNHPEAKLPNKQH